MTDHDPTLPFLGQRHVELVDRLRDWCDKNAHLWAHPPADQAMAERQCLSIVGQLGADGWLDFLSERDEQDRSAWDFRSICLAREQLAHTDDLADFAYSIQALSAMPLARHGNPDQRSRYLHRLADGSLIGSFAISELAAGSNLAAIETRAEQTDTGWLLDGAKAWIANGSTAALHTVIARTGDGPGLLGLSAFLVPADTPGCSIERVDVLAPRPFAHLRFDNCELSADSLLGGRGRGFVIAMDLLEHFRMTVGAAAVGFARRAAQATLVHVRQRRIGAETLFGLDSVKATLAQIETDLSASWLLVLRAAWEADRRNPRFGKHSSMAKLHATENAQRVVDQAVQLFGASGVVAGGLTERLYRQVRLLRIYEGASEVQLATIASTLDFARLTAPGAGR
jgi:acyl-CoA dehydrogenase